MIISNHAVMTEASKWRLLLDFSSFLLNQKLPIGIEDYIASLLVKEVHYPNKAIAHDTDIELEEVAEQCLLISGLFPEQPLQPPFSLRYFIDTGIDSYKKLARLDPEHKPYQLLAQRFMLVIDVLHQLRALCIGQEIFDPMQAYEVWLETGSHYARHLLANISDGFPLSMHYRSIQMH